MLGSNMYQIKSKISSNFLQILNKIYGYSIPNLNKLQYLSAKFLKRHYLIPRMRSSQPSLCKVRKCLLRLSSFYQIDNSFDVWAPKPVR